MSVIAYVELLLRAEFADGYIGRLFSALPQTRAAPGCLAISAYRDQEDLRRIMLVEHWETRADYDAYVARRRSTGSFDKLAAILEEPLTVRMMDKIA